MTPRFLGFRSPSSRPLVSVGTEIIGDLRQQSLVEAGVVGSSLKGLHHDLCSRLGSTHGEGGHSAVDNVHACLHSLQVSHGSHAGGIMGVKLNGKVRGLLKSRHQLRCLVGKQQAGHILDADGIRSHLFDLLCHGGPVFQGIGVSQCIGQGTWAWAFSLLAALTAVCRLRRSFIQSKIRMMSMPLAADF